MTLLLSLSFAKASSPKLIYAGILQGSLLGPLLFIIYIDDIHEKLENHTVLHADDS